MTDKLVAFSPLECKALWLIADAGYHMPNPDLERDPDLEAAADSALRKVYASHMGRAA